MPKHFTNLPRELRNQIYEEVWKLSPELYLDLRGGIRFDVTYENTTSDAYWDEEKLPSWLLVSKKVFSEGWAELNRRSVATVYLKDPPNKSQIAHQIKELDMLPSSRKLNIHLLSANQQRLGDRNKKNSGLRDERVEYKDELHFRALMPKLMGTSPQTLVVWMTASNTRKTRKGDLFGGFRLLRAVKPLKHQLRKLEVMIYDRFEDNDDLRERFEKALRTAFKALAEDLEGMSMKATRELAIHDEWQPMVFDNEYRWRYTFTAAASQSSISWTFGRQLRESWLGFYERRTSSIA